MSTENVISFHENPKKKLKFYVLYQNKTKICLEQNFPFNSWTFLPFEIKIIFKNITKFPKCIIDFRIYVLDPFCFFYWFTGVL